jgi:mono/diheme cytochrome c family protein
MRTRIAMHAAVLAAMLAGAPPLQAQPDQARGKALLETRCGVCHAVDEGKSRHSEAPPFREVAKRYAPEQLEEALGEGLSTGHPDMPEFKFAPPDISAIVAYLNLLRSAR